MPDVIERPSDWDSYIDGAIDIYVTRRARARRHQPRHPLRGRWLRANKPPPVPLGLVHGDFQPGNILVAEGRPPIVIDWEFARIGDPREDIGYYSGSPLPDSLYAADPEAFLAEYRERTGFTEEQVNPQVMEYFFILGMAELFVQMMQGADDLARGRAEGHHGAVPHQQPVLLPREVPRDLHPLTGHHADEAWGTMIAKPTTEQILNDCSRELMEVVLPAVTDQTVMVTIFMMDLVLRNCAVRAAHEIAWMTEEIAALEAFTGSGVAADRERRRQPPPRRRRRAVPRGERGLLPGDGGRRRRWRPGAHGRGAAVLAERVAREQEVMCGWSPVGR